MGVASSAREVRGASRAPAIAPRPRIPRIRGSRLMARSRWVDGGPGSRTASLRDIDGQPFDFEVGRQREVAGGRFGGLGRGLRGGALLVLGLVGGPGGDPPGGD